MEISVFISPHGFGHAARAIAILEEIHRHIPGLTTRLLTTAPRILFRELSMPWSYHPVVVDVGLVQQNAFYADLSATTKALQSFLPFPSRLIETCSDICKSSSLILCDISPLGIYISRRLKIPSVLVENFTWDWIYRKLPEKPIPDFFVNYLQEQFYSATVRIQTEPLCTPPTFGTSCPPIARKIKTASEIIEKTVGNNNRKIVLITTGGVPQDITFIEHLSQYSDFYFILAGQKKHQQLHKNTLLLPFETPLFHPDLINSSSLVICKSGYSTIAECAQSNTAICCVSRPAFAETAVIEKYVSTHLGGTILGYQQFHNGSWLNILPELFDTRKKINQENGARKAGHIICSLI